MRFMPVAFIVLLILFPSVTWGGAEVYHQREQHDLVFQNEDHIRTHIQAYTAELAAGTPVTIEGEKIFARTILPRFYERLDYAPAWKDFDALGDAFAALKTSYEDGLIPEDYHMEGMIQIVARLQALDTIEPSDYQWVAKFDLLMTDAVLMYGYHLLEGKVDPNDLDVHWNYDHAELPGAGGEVLARAIAEKNVSGVLHGLRPDIPGYAILMDKLADFRAVARSGGWHAIPASGLIKPGASDNRLPSIRARLESSGDLTDRAGMESALYDKNLENDIRDFQARHGLDADGVIGKATFAALNVPVQERIAQIRVNLERSRWVAHNLPDEFVVVNIARFRVWAVQDEIITHRANVQVGTDRHKTPVFKSRLKYIEFNPTWTVPRSITMNEMLSKVKKDHNYLRNNNMVLLNRAGAVVPFSSVNFGALSANNFPYTIRQEPGPDNALGVMKFIFPNQYAVYLHDTPSKSLFGRASRSFSHGCIRVQNPGDLAEVLLKGTAWDRKKIEETLASKVTTRAHFEKPIDVLLLYWTVGVYQGEGVFFFPDIYQRDQKVLQKLNRDVEEVSVEKFNKITPGS